MTNKLFLRSNVWIIIILLLSPLKTAISAQRTESGWNALAGRNLSSVAWSPSGDYIAFVATPKLPEATNDYYVPSADIWLQEVSSKNGQANLRRLIHTDAAQGIPTALFWKASDQLGWASAGVNTKGFAFYTTTIDHIYPQVLMDNRFRLSQTLHMVDEYAPEDVYWDAKTGVLWFSCLMTAFGTEDIGAICSYDTRTKIQSFMLLPGYISVNVCSWTKDQSIENRSALYYTVECSGGNRLSRGLFKRDLTNPEVRTVTKLWASKEPIYYPRVSPDGKLLAWLQTNTGPRHEVDRIILYDLNTKKSKNIVSIQENGGVYDDPKLGCPFSWSPDGKKIAYVDGSRIRTADVETPR